MVLPLLIGLGSFGARLGFSGGVSQIFGAGAKTLGTSLLFGSGYSLGTYIGFPANYQSRNPYKGGGSSYSLNTMPYGRNYGYSRRRNYAGYSRYGRGRYRRSYRRSYY